MTYSAKWVRKSAEIKDKQYYRNSVWHYLEKNNIALFPRPVHHRIPNFVGAEDAARNLLKLECFQHAKSIKINPDKPQQFVRYLALKMGKRVFVPTPRLKSTHGFLNEIVIPSHLHTNDNIVQKAATRKGLSEFGHLLTLQQMSQHNVKIDVCVVGSVVVDKRNGYRIGKGEGYADLEIALLNEFGLIDAHTIFIATVHDCQVYASLEAGLFNENDVILDYIVTPTQVIKLDHAYHKKSHKLPYKIQWDKLSHKRLNEMPFLKTLRSKKESSNRNERKKQIQRW